MRHFTGPMAFLIILGVICISIGVVLYVVERNQRGRAFSLRSAKPATVADLTQLAQAVAQDMGGGSWRDYVKLTGTVDCDRPLRSELTQDACVYYSMTVEREYEETVTRKDDDGDRHTETERGSEVVSSNARSAPFWLSDGTGKIEVEPDGAVIDAEQVLDEFRTEGGRNGSISYGSFSLDIGQPRSGRRTLGYHYRESLLPLNRRVLVVGMVSDQAGRLVLQKPIQSSQRFMVSLKTDEALIAESDRTAINAALWMKICLVAGAILILIGTLL